MRAAGRSWRWWAAALLMGGLTGAVGAEVRAAEVAIVFSRDLDPYYQAAAGLRASLKGTGASFSDYNLDGDLNRARAIMHKIRSRQTSLIVAVGSLALKAVGEDRQTPILFMMVLNPERKIPRGARNVAGVTMEVDVNRQFEGLQRILPEAGRIGVLFNPGRSATQIDEGRRVTQRKGLTLVEQPVENVKAVPGALREMLGEIDALWLIADHSIITADSLEFIMLETTKQNTPVMALSERFTKAGALFSLGVDYKDIGRQTAEMARRILQQAAPPSGIGFERARTARLNLNARVAKVLGISIPQPVLDSAHSVIE